MSVATKHLVWLTVVCCCTCAVAAQEPPEAGGVVRVGVVIAEAGPGESSPDPVWQELFTRWEALSGLQFQYAKGTHSDVLHWMHHRVVDLAVLPAGALIQEEKVEQQVGEAAERAAWTTVPSPHFEYLATFGYPPAATDFAEQDRRTPGFHWFHRSVCVVSRRSRLNSQEDLVAAIREGTVHFLMVHPYSASGSLLAQSVLLELLGTQLPAARVEYTFSHTESLEKLAVSEGEFVAFVFDGALDQVPEIAGELKRIELPRLTEMRIPNEVILLRTRSPYAERLRGLANENGGTRHLSFHRFDDWQTRYGQVGVWSRGVRVPDVGFETRRLSLEEIGWLLLYSARFGHTPPRLAVVLSGGGAKCSYQVGVVDALEEKLAEMRETIPHLTQEQRASLDIHLVVGTSGGALNALPVALGVSTTEEGREAFKRVWMAADQRDILLPPMTQRVLLGLWFGLLQLGVLMWLARRLIRNPARRRWILAGSLVVLGVAELVIRDLDWSPWTHLGTNHLWHHLFLVFSFAVRASAWGLIAAGTIGLLVHWLAPDREHELGAASRNLVRVLAVLFLILPTCGVMHLLFHQKTLSAGVGVERQVIATFSELIATPTDFATADRSDQLRQLSLAAEQSLQRDLVITGTCLPQAEGEKERELPDDLYFYARPNRSVEPSPFGVRGVSLNDSRYRHMWLDVIMGSGSVFPVFPPRVLRDFPVAGESVEMVDGAFAHNSPIEAAVMWGATHVVVIESTPESRSSRKNFVSNVAAALGHLHQQTQQVDRRSKQHVRVFTLEPRPPHLCILCFADNLIERAICSGYFDAAGTRHPYCGDVRQAADDQTLVGHWFEEDLGPPDFVEVGLQE